MLSSGAQISAGLCSMQEVFACIYAYSPAAARAGPKITEGASHNAGSQMLSLVSAECICLSCWLHAYTDAGGQLRSNNVSSPRAALQTFLCRNVERSMSTIHVHLHVHRRGAALI